MNRAVETDQTAIGMEATLHRRAPCSLSVPKPFYDERKLIHL